MCSSFRGVAIQAGSRPMNLKFHSASNGSVQWLSPSQVLVCVTSFWGIEDKDINDLFWKLPTWQSGADDVVLSTLGGLFQATSNRNPRFYRPISFGYIFVRWLKKNANFFLYADRNSGQRDGCIPPSSVNGCSIIHSWLLLSSCQQVFQQVGPG
jgi:hypothetical protein